ncbi:uncharacterized protein LOC119109455 isoform X2 [Pollicipes pollicipes]|uniref:uncharacterized protein LOC119109455 isoform X2 n=1 Tax=Pollicipes pollicipes TaxID=41117 RepID=UPI001884DCA5|nr:uncharacterized protein LOC119109455 isoform X2 [Pollicipes pollicipes]
MEPWKAHHVVEQGTESLSDCDIVVLERYRAFRRSTMAGACPQKQFDAAVHLIRGLPKNGPFQPSNDMKLKLYGFFKQATEGPCTQPAPSFWDLVGKAKWGAWKSLGDMPPEEAMLEYVEEIKKVMETMSLTEDVASLMDTLGPVYEYVDDGKADRPAKKKHVRFSSDAAPTTNGHVADEPAATNGHATPPAANGLPAPDVNGGHAPEVERWVGAATSDTDDDDEFNDPIGGSELVQARDGAQTRLDALQQRVETLSQLVDSAGAQILDGRLETACARPGLEAAKDAAGGVTVCPEVHDELRALLRDMRADLDTVTGRLRALEAASGRAQVKERPWWQVPELSARSLLLLLCWPLVLQLALRLLRARRPR